MPTRWTFRATLGILLCLAFATHASGAEDSPIEEALGYREQVERLFAAMNEGEYGAAIEQLHSNNPWMASKPDELANLKTQLQSLPELVGTLHGHELVAEQWITDRYVFLWYVARFDRSPLSFYFKFYRPQDEWRFYSFEYKEDLGKIAREMAVRRLYEESAAPAADDLSPQTTKPASRP